MVYIYLPINLPILKSKIKENIFLFIIPVLIGNLFILFIYNNPVLKQDYYI
jgi:hypothetical protein